MKLSNIVTMLSLIDDGIYAAPIPRLRRDLEQAMIQGIGSPSSIAPHVGSEYRALANDLNDIVWWGSPHVRAKGLRRLAVVMLGTDEFSPRKADDFSAWLAKSVIADVLPRALQAAATEHIGRSQNFGARLHDAADKCAGYPTRETAYAAAATADDAGHGGYYPATELAWHAANAAAAYQFDRVKYASAAADCVRHTSHAAAYDSTAHYGDSTRAAHAVLDKFVVELGNKLAELNPWGAEYLPLLTLREDRAAVDAS